MNGLHLGITLPCTGFLVLIIVITAFWGPKWRRLIPKNKPPQLLMFVFGLSAVIVCLTAGIIKDNFLAGNVPQPLLPIFDGFVGAIVTFQFGCIGALAALRQELSLSLFSTRGRPAVVIGILMVVIFGSVCIFVSVLTIVRIINYGYNAFL